MKIKIYLADAKNVTRPNVGQQLGDVYYASTHRKREGYVRPVRAVSTEQMSQNSI